ncbi:GGDEF domain-containing protein [Spirilliplanes yamanashiensis]|uniref:GGDEF domain-containing protein n=1 Tax=Spirilliplanes yamanashiensis TaxID=42233 RepID=A0A8J4DKF0_9ACTN|nr:GGDEF domain-containing protein [Spirilliplanes yamanashiensis]MDP9818002.1 diguanylate cyclase (GGDEF)-like protein [Spirilliplanes yamanashiensis]GIJ04811.1 hypothetical protein Sya03_41630 [Spirilliplanes yamanashiensis]
MGRENRAWRWWAAAGVAAIAGYPLLPAESTASTTYYNVLVLACVLAIGVAAPRRAAPGTRAVWYLIGAGQLAWAGGDLLFSWYEAQGLDPFPSPADVVYLAGYPLLGAGILLLVRRRTRGGDRGGLIDAAIVSTGVSLLAWVYVIMPMTQESGVPALQKGISLAYPGGDLVLIVLLIRLYTSRGARTVSYWLMSFAVVAVLGADAIFTGLITTDSGVFNLVAEMLWMSSYFGFAAAAWHGSAARTAAATRQATGLRTTPGVRPGRLTVLALASLLAPAVLFQQGLTDPTRIDWLPIAAGAMVLFILVVLRMRGLVMHVQRQAAQLAAIANRDGLTGAPNRRAWDTGIAAALAHARRRDEPVVVALLDLDHFKQYNDRHGHLAGDRLLREAADAWAGRLRTQDLIARYGGEEFAVLLPGALLGEATEIMERLRGATPGGQTFSAGLALWDGAETAEALVARADTALYAAKRAGRDRITPATTPVAVPASLAA